MRDLLLRPKWRRRGALALIALSVSMTGTVGATQGVSGAEEPVTGGWTGTINVTHSYTFEQYSHVRVGVITGSYSDLTTSDSLNYSANVHVTFEEGNTYPDCHALQNWEYNGSSAASVLPDGSPLWQHYAGYAFELYDRPDGTYFFPKHVVFNAPMAVSCTGYPTMVLLQGSNALSYHVTGAVAPELPLVDTDPDPDHLVGTTTIGLSDIPGGADVSYTAYAYTIRYDLSRTGGARDRDRDGIPDASDYCPDTYGSTTLWGCKPFVLTAKYAYTGFAGPAVLNGGDTAQVEGDDLSWLGNMCIVETWTATIKNPRSEVNVLWNGLIAVGSSPNVTFIDRTLPTRNVGPLKIPKFPNGVYIETIQLRTCGSPGLLQSHNIQSVTPFTGELIGLSHSQTTYIYRSDGALIGSVGLPSSSMGKKLSVIWLEQESKEFR